MRAAFRRKVHIKNCIQILESKTKGLDNVKFVHNKVVEAYDGNYQLDGYIEFEVMRVLYKTIVECKHYSYPISREIVQKVYDNLRAIGAQKGIIVSTSNFQSGAIAYAKAHGIALIQMTETEDTFHTRSHYSVIMNHSHVPDNGGLPYIGVMIGNGPDGIGVTCAYLHPFSDKLKQFLLDETGEA